MDEAEVPEPRSPYTTFFLLALAGIAIVVVLVFFLGMAYKGDTLVSFGFGIDLAKAASGYPAERIADICSANGESKKAISLHNHGVVFRGIPYNPTLDLNSQVKKIVSEGTFVDMRHLLDSTRLRRAKIGVAYIQDIVKDQ